MTHPLTAREPRIARLHSTYRSTADTLNGLSWLPNLLLRITVGFMFFSGAVGKLADLGKFTAMFVSLGIPAAQIVAPVTALVEFVGGAALMLGVGTRLVSLVLAGDMVGALLTDIGPDLAHKYPTPWYFLSNLFYASEWLLVGLLLWLVCAGAGRASLDAVVARRLATLTSAD
jgi:putative oxidoreductase